MSNAICPCGSGNALNACCGRYLDGEPAPTAETLMRSRYSAYVLGIIDYLRETTLPAQQPDLDMNEIRRWSQQSTWLGLRVERCQLLKGTPEHACVTFSVRWHDGREERVHHENAGFVQIESRWYFLDPNTTGGQKRNAQCLCGSGKKSKRCCGQWLD